MKKNLNLFLMALLSVLAAGQLTWAQSSFLPQNLGKTVNSGYDETNPVVTPDGKTLFFVRANHPNNNYGSFDSQDIWFSEWINEQWSEARLVPGLNNARYNAILSISPDGRTILLNGVFNKKGTFFKKRGLSISTLTSAGWSTPEALRVKRLRRMNGGLNAGATLSNDGKYMILALTPRYNRKRMDLYVAERKSDSKFGRPKRLADISSRQQDQAPFLSADGKTLYFASDRSGNFDIYATHPKNEKWKEWSKPVRLSDTINTKGWESYFRTTLKGSVAYYASTNQSTGAADIFKVKLFEENPFVEIKGIVTNARTALPLTGKGAWKISINGAVVDSVRIQADSATYKVRLPLGKKYELRPVAEHYTSSAGTIDVSKVREFTKARQDLTLAPYQWVRVEGQALVRGTTQPIPSDAKPVLWIDNMPADTIQLDPLTGKYEMRIKHGKAYQMQVKATRYESAPVTLDLTRVDGYQELHQDLYAEKEKEKGVTLAGTIFDKKTGKPAQYRRGMRVSVDQHPEWSAAIDTANSRYEIRLMPGAVYTVGAESPGYFPVFEKIDLSAEKDAARYLKDLTIVPVEVGQSIRLNNIFFESGRAVLKKESFAELDKVVKFLQENADLHIEIAGHTDNSGSAALNLQLSNARAKAVVDYIASKGIDKSRLVGKGYGMTKPVASNATKDGMAQNRRVEFTIL
ncbi:MAG: OmpA family protein [Cyclobacteriaceae bacterium]|nr:OmpA family protein [Cyclobacteriaceae bacterium]